VPGPERTSVPLVDLTPWYAGDAGDRRAVATRLDAALCEVGFLLLTGHGVGPDVTDPLRREVRSFFALPSVVKAELACRPGGRGWVPPGTAAMAGSDGLVTPPDLKESFTFGSDGVPPAGTADEAWSAPNRWPARLPGLCHAAQRYARSCARLTEELLRVCALALDLPDDVLVARCGGDAWTADLTWHPARDRVGTVLPGQYRTGQHTDPGTLTLTDRRPASGGLQVRSVEGSWVDVPCAPGALTVNAGDLLARWTGDRWRSSPHRVLPPPVDVPDEELLSLVFCAQADPLTVVETLPTVAAGPERYAPVTAGEFLRARLDSVTLD
jgi:isopenicillin N synthase-like dioxygenase